MSGSKSSHRRGSGLPPAGPDPGPKARVSVQPPSPQATPARGDGAGESAARAATAPPGREGSERRQTRRPSSKAGGNTPGGRFASLISHELRNPLAIIKSQAQLMERESSAQGDTTPGGEALYRSCIIRRAVDRLEALVEQWLEVERLDSGELQPSLSPLTLLPWLDELVRTSGREYQRPMRLLAPRDLAKIQVRADRALLTAAIHHLLDNAIKFSAPSSAIQIQLSCSGDEVAIEVKDAGIGIAADDLEDIYQKFMRIAPESNVAGMGLGLYLTQRVANLHAGRIEAVSTLGQGSSFTLWLPLSS